DDPRLPGAVQRRDQEGEDRPREIERAAERRGERHQRPEQPLAQFDQMVEQRRLGVVDVLHEAALLSAGASGSASRITGCSVIAGAASFSTGASGAAGSGAGSAGSGAFRIAEDGNSRMMRSFSSFHFFSISASSASRTIASKPERNWR